MSPEYTNAVQPVGQRAHFSNLPPPSARSTFRTGHMVHTVQSTNGPVRMPVMTSSPAVQLPGQRPQASVLAPTPMASGSGYTKNHHSYQLTRQSLANTAYALHGGNVIIVEVRVMYMPIGRIKALLIGVSCMFDSIFLDDQPIFRIYFKPSIMFLFKLAQLSLNNFFIMKLYLYGIVLPKDIH